MLNLEPEALVGKGLHRECYEHPEDPALCVKVVVAGDSNENRREARYYRMLSRRGISWNMLTRFHGLVETSLGEGALFDLVRDFNGDVSHQLDYYLDGQRYAKDVSRCLGDMKAYLLENRIVTMTLKPKNILYQRLSEDTGKLVIVDNVGNTDFVPLSNYIPILGRRKMVRKWRRLEHLLADHPSSLAESSRGTV